MAEVRIRDLTKSYGAMQVVHGVNVDIQDGQFVVLVGPSGCGKSTLLRMIAGLEGITGGTVSIGDRVVNNLPPAERDIAMVFQNYALYPHKTVGANMGFPLKMAGMTKAEIDTRVNRAADILGLKPYLDRYPRALSGGQRQRVAMGRAIVRDPQVFLFDEPLSNLDAKLRVQMRSEIRELHQRLGTTTVYVTHDQIEAMTMADRIVVMREGRISQVGAPLELYDRPIAGEVSGDRFKGGGVDLPMPAGVAVAQGQKLTYGIRPEHLTLSDKGQAVTVVVVEPTGAEIHLVLRAGDVEMTAVVRERQAFQPGQTLHIAPQAGMVHLFDEAGDRIG